MPVPASSSETPSRARRSRPSPSPSSLHSPRIDKGKGKAREYLTYGKRDGTVTAGVEGGGGSDGVVLPLDMIGSSAYDVSYSLPVQIGSQNLSLQVDTGSSDMWVASTSCSSSSCKSATHYDPSSSPALPSGQTFGIQYLSGNVSGPIVWDTVSVGGYSIDHQALAAVTDVQNEPLSPDFSGILGLALPKNSIIAQRIPPGTSNAPDGAPLASNLFSISPAADAPPAPFLSLSLARPGATYPPAQLGLGRHPAFLSSLPSPLPAFDPGKVQYTPLVSSPTGTMYWKADIEAVTVYENGVAKRVQLGRSVDGRVFPSAVLDSGVPVILATKALADGLYGALGVSASGDGHYYMPCDSPLNMTLTLSGLAEIPLHPLDLTAPPPSAASASTGASNCVGLIQSADAYLTATSGIGDMVLGVPFLRNVYTVLAFAAPLSSGNGAFPSPDTVGTGNTDIDPRLGLVPLTDPTTALDEFHKVRVLNQPLSPSANSPADERQHGMSVGVKVLIGLLAFFGLCVALFAVRFVVVRRRYRLANRGLAPGGGGDTKDGYEYALADRGLDKSEDALRARRYAAWKREQERSEDTASTAFDTFKPDDTRDAAENIVDALALKPRGLEGVEPWEDALNSSGLPKDSGDADREAEGEGEVDEGIGSDEDEEDFGGGHVRQHSGEPLLPGGEVGEFGMRAGEVVQSPVDEDTVGVIGVGGGGMAGVGTAARGSVIDADVLDAHRRTGSASLGLDSGRGSGSGGFDVGAFVSRPECARTTSGGAGILDTGHDRPASGGSGGPSVDPINTNHDRPTSGASMSSRPEHLRTASGGSASSVRVRPPRSPSGPRGLGSVREDAGAGT